MVETFQDEWELQQLVGLFWRLMPARTLEIGAMYGGTLYHWLAGGTVVCVDDEMRDVRQWKVWAKATNSHLVLVQGRSQDPAVVAEVREHAPYDFCFIDADHTYEAVKADWENYGPMCSVVAFHDIVARPGYGVSDLWAEIKAVPGVQTMEIVRTVSPDYESKCGIGVVWT